MILVVLFFYAKLHILTEKKLYIHTIQCSAIGSTVAYLISASLGSVAVVHLIGDRIAKWNEQLVNHKQHMLNYMVVLRIAPLPPNWTINLGAPHLQVPIGAFFWGTFIGRFDNNLSSKNNNENKIHHDNVRKKRKKCFTDIFSIFSIYLFVYYSRSRTSFVYSRASWCRVRQVIII